jgi:hypothetical protein
MLPQLVGLGIGFLQLAHPATQAFTNTLKLWLVGAAKQRVDHDCFASQQPSNSILHKVPAVQGTGVFWPVHTPAITRALRPLLRSAVLTAD